MPDGVRTAAHLSEVVSAYEAFDEFVFDVETIGATKEERLDPLRNQVFWISLAGSRAMRRCSLWPPAWRTTLHGEGETSFRRNAQERYQERRVNPDSGREKWYDIPAQLDPAPKQALGI